MNRDELIKEAREFDHAEHPLFELMADFALDHEKRVRAEIAGEIRNRLGDATDSAPALRTKMNHLAAKLESADTVTLAEGKECPCFKWEISAEAARETLNWNYPAGHNPYCDGTGRKRQPASAVAEEEDKRLGKG